MSRVKTRVAVVAIAASRICDFQLTLDFAIARSPLPSHANKFQWKERSFDHADAFDANSITAPSEL